MEEIQFHPVFHYQLRFEVPAQVLKELVSSRIQLMGAPYLHMPPGTRNLQVVSDKAWVEWPSLEGALTGRMRGHLASGAALGSRQWGLVAYRGGGVIVRIEYLADDYWWVECLMPAEEDYERWQASIGAGPAAAVLLVEESRFNLTDTSENPVWFFPEG